MWICFLIVLSGVVCVVETVPGWREEEELWFAFETFLVAGFSIEFVMRLVPPISPESKNGYFNPN